VLDRVHALHTSIQASRGITRTEAVADVIVLAAEVHALRARHQHRPGGRQVDVVLDRVHALHTRIQASRGVTRTEAVADLIVLAAEVHALRAKHQHRSGGRR
jgi:uncharacterized membrane-anchored protein